MDIAKTAAWIAVCPTADGSVLHILDAGKCGVRIGSYALKP